MLQQLREFEATVSVSLNPLNWIVGLERYSFGIHAYFGPLRVLVIW